MLPLACWQDVEFIVNYPEPWNPPFDETLNHSGFPRLLTTVMLYCLPRWISSTPICRRAVYPAPPSSVPDIAGWSLFSNRLLNVGFLGNCSTRSSVAIRPYLSRPNVVSSRSPGTCLI
jgi:hypothetical protein